MILIVDNYDSFVYNIARYFEELGQQVVVKRNDAVDEADLKAKAIVISPGPCTPHEAGDSLDIVRKLSGRLPILGVCLGHQCIGEAFGGKVNRAATGRVDREANTPVRRQEAHGRQGRQGDETGQAVARANAAGADDLLAA